jgi:hypothetical protein
MLPSKQTERIDMAFSSTLKVGGKPMWGKRTSLMRDPYWHEDHIAEPLLRSDIVT